MLIELLGPICSTCGGDVHRVNLDPYSVTESGSLLQELLCLLFECKSVEGLSTMNNNHK